jgi:preprotein translocase subunit SecE
MWQQELAETRQVGTMAEALKMKEREIRGGGGEGGSGALDKLGEHPKRLRNFLHDVRVEMDKVSWPSRQDVISTTTVVIVTVALFGCYFLITDTVASWFITKLIDFGKTH